jgi:hypothetical protein
VLIDWTGEFDTWLDRLGRQAVQGDANAVEQAGKVDAAFSLLESLAGEPSFDTPSLKAVRQSKRYKVWRTSHSFTAGIAIRLIVWFPPHRPGEVVVVLFAADKAQMGDVFYDSVGTRSDAAISSYLRQTEGESQ